MGLQRGYWPTLCGACTCFFYLSNTPWMCASIGRTVSRIKLKACYTYAHPCTFENTNRLTWRCISSTRKRISALLEDPRIS